MPTPVHPPAAARVTCATTYLNTAPCVSAACAHLRDNLNSAPVQGCGSRAGTAQGQGRRPQPRLSDGPHLRHAQAQDEPAGLQEGKPKRRERERGRGGREVACCRCCCVASARPPCCAAASLAALLLSLSPPVADQAKRAAAVPPPRRLSALPRTRHLRRGALCRAVL